MTPKLNLSQQAKGVKSAIDGPVHKSYIFGMTNNRVIRWENFKMLSLILSGPGGGGGRGAKRPRWPNSKLLIRNLLRYDAHTL